MLSERRTGLTAAAMLCVAALHGLEARATDADCGRLATLSLPDATIAATAIEADPPFVIEADTLSRRAVAVTQPFCRVQGRLEKEIHFEVWLPAVSAWNGKHLGVGNGGYAGFINYSALAHGLARGYATAATDTGHTGGPADATWALGQPQRIEDYGGRAQHLTAQAAKKIVEEYYSKRPQYSYFIGCSNGGQQGLTAAQRYPDDYDGIVSGAPGTSFPDMSTYVMLSGRHNAAAGALTQSQMEHAVASVLAACDAIDGAKDGLIEHPPACKFDFSALACRKSTDAHCLSDAQIETMRELHSPLKDTEGREIYPPPALGTLLPVSELARRGKLGADMYRYMVFGDPQWNPSSFVLQRDLPIAREKLRALISDDANLLPFASRGGRLILYHGWNDSGPSPFNSIRYYEDVKRTVRMKDTHDFFRLFMVPGMYHCRGGPGPDSFGNAGDPPALDPDHDILMALERWVEQGKPPSRIIASKVVDAHVERTRPLCPYPQQARYDGKGDIDRADSFSCVTP